MSTLKGIKKNANDVDDKLVAANLLRKTQELVQSTGNQPIGIGLTVTSIFSGRRILFGSKAISVHYLFVMTYDTFSRTIMDGVRSSVLVIQKLFILIVDLQ